MSSTLEQARTFFVEGVADYEAGRLQAAERKFAAALSLAPQRPSVLTNLGAVRLKLGRAAEALPLLEEALAQEPDNEEALGHCATACAELGRPEQALALFDRLLARAPGLGAAWSRRGNLLRELGRLEEAAASFRNALAHGADPELNRYYLAGLEASEPPARPPRAYVQALFDTYAGEFDRHVVQALRYDAPRKLASRLGGRRFAHALDLGCGTGLGAPRLRPLAGRLTGVDLSPAMLAKARSGGLYDALHAADALEFLAAGDDRFDLVVAADVFIYVGALDAVFAALARRMPAGGCFCFTVEEAPARELELRASLRYAHSEAYLRRLAAAHGFAVEALERAALREEQRVPIPGLFAWLVRAD